MRRLSAALLATACASAPVPEAPAPALDDGAWIVQMVTSPSAFEELISADRSGWVALHANDLPGAWTELAPGVHRARAAWELARLFEDLERTSTLAHRQLAAERRDRAALPSDSAGHAVAALAEHCGQGEPPWTFDAPESLAAALETRALLHRSAREGDIKPLTRAAVQPLLVEQAANFERTWWDPCLLGSLADGWQVRLRGEVDGADWRAAFQEAGLAGAMFAPWLVQTNLMEQGGASGVVGAAMSQLAALDVPPALPSDDERQGARDVVRTLDTSLEALHRHLSAVAPPEGVAILDELAPIARWRQEFLLARARAHLDAGHPRRAEILVQLAHDATERGVGVANKPTVFALAAETRLRGARVREALDALQTLTDTYPEVSGLKEVTGDLAVLRSLDRSGDSKEN